MFHRLSIKTIIYYIIISTFLLGFLTAFSLFMLRLATNEKTEMQEKRYISYLLADELRQSSDDLTRLARTYVVTAEPKYEQEYWTVLDIRNGKKPRPEKYHQIYWDFMAVSDTKPRPDGESIPLQELMKKNGFTDEEFALLKKAEANSNGLVKLETIAMNAVKGLFDDGTGNFTKKGEPDLVLARTLMHSPQYHQYKAQIMQPVNDFFEMMEKRTALAVESAVEKTTLYLNITMLSIVLLILNFLFSIHVLSKKISNPLKQLLEISQQIIAGKFNFDVKVSEENDEITLVMLSMQKMQTILKESILEISRVMAAVAKGDMSQRVNIHMIGEFDTLKNNINFSVNRVEETLNEISDVMTALSKGDFSKRVSSKIEGRFKQAVDDSMIVIEKVLHDINLAMFALANGDLSKRVNVEAQGDLNKLKNSVNNSMEMIEAVTNDLNHTIGDLAKGNLKQINHNQHYHGVFNQLVHNAGTAIVSLRTLIQRVFDTSAAISTVSSEINQGNNDLAARTSRQVADIEETANNVQNVSQIAQENAIQARKANEQVTLSKSVAVRGDHVIQEVMSMMGGIHLSAQKISEIISILDNITFQTNILALNAAVEAARAGEQGKSFAVVANEVRMLANHSTSASKDIRVLIENTVEQVQEGSQLVSKAGNTMQEIMHAVQEITDVMQFIRVSSDDQAQKIEEVKRVLEQLNQMTQQNAALVEEIAASSDALNGQTTQLNTAIQIFAL